MASGTADLQRDLGGAIMQSILGALLTAGYAAAVAAAIASAPASVQAQDHRQHPGTAHEVVRERAKPCAQQYPKYANQIVAGAKRSFLDGADWAYTAGIVAIVLGAALVFFLFPRKAEEESLLARYHAEDTSA